MPVALSVLKILCNFVYIQKPLFTINVDTSVIGKSSLLEATFNIRVILGTGIIFCHVCSGLEL